MNQEWFEMRNIRKRRAQDAVWVPLRLCEPVEESGLIARLGYRHEFVGLGSVAVPLAKREQAKGLGWSEIGLIHNQGVYSSREHYKPADVYWEDDGIDLGVELVLEQSFSGMEPKEWHLNQDVVFARRLLRERDEWVCPTEDYKVVARLRRSADDRAVALEIRNEFLRDYLAARQMVLRLSMYRQREVVVDAAPGFSWPQDGLCERVDDDRFEARIFEMLEGGDPIGASYAVFHVARTDVDPDEDVPTPGPESDLNTKATSWTGARDGKRVFRVSGELWRNEWIEPAANSLRVRGDKAPTGISYVVDASGARMTSELLDDEDIGRWLWFRSEVVPALTARRGASLSWYTQDTGGVSCSTSYGPVHFGINTAGLINVYASDVAKLPLWQQQIWAGFNVTPEGKVSPELLMAQMEARPASTTSPERVLPEILAELDRVFDRRLGGALFRVHSLTNELLQSVHRFRSIMPGGVLALAKDVVRITADRIDSAGLQRVVQPPAKEKWGSLKSLEKYLGTIVSPAEARDLMRVLVGIYELRVADAHLPPKDLANSYALVGVDIGKPALQQGFDLIASVVKALVEILRVVDRGLPA